MAGPIVPAAQSPRDTPEWPRHDPGVASAPSVGPGDMNIPM